MTTPTKTIATAIAQHLAAAGVAVWNPTGAYASTDTAITIKAVPQSPDRIVALTVYDRVTHRDPDLTDEVVRVQVRVRAGKYPTDVDDLADAVHGALEVHHATWPGLRVTRCHRISLLPLGPDGSGRHETSMNYELQLAD